MRKRLLAVLAALLFCFAVGSKVEASTHHNASVSAAQTIAMFDSETAAQAHCPSERMYDVPIQE